MRNQHANLLIAIKKLITSELIASHFSKETFKNSLKVMFVGLLVAILKVCSAAGALFISI